MEKTQDNLTVCSPKQKEDIEKMIGIYKRIPDDKKELLLMLMRSYMEGLEAGASVVGFS